MRFRLLLLLPAFISQVCSAQFKPSISFEQWLSLKTVGGVAVSPDGKHVLFGVTSTNWKDNTYDSEIWLSRSGEAPFQLTNTAEGSSSNAQFTPDSKWVSFLATRGNKQQLHLISIHGGEAFAITDESDGVGGYSWRPDMQQIAFTKIEQESAAEKSQKEKYGAFELRINCPCAGCVDEWTGEKTLRPDSVSKEISISAISIVGRYALNFHFSDGHDTGIFSFRFMKDFADGR